jgi:nitroreductase
MKTLDAILGRRSIRNFQKKEVTDEVINILLESARWAPSGDNGQPWRFIVVRDPKRRKLIKTVSPGMSGDPPVIIVACVETGRDPQVIEDSYLDMGATIQNMLIAAHSLGLGTCWVGSTNWSGIRSAIELAENSDSKPVSLISLGYSAEESPPKRKRKPIQEIAFLDTTKKKWERK